MRNTEERKKEFLLLKAEGEAIKKEIKSNEELKDLEVTPAMDKKMAKLINTFYDL